MQLDPDHPGFRDPGYRERRNQIARIAFEHEGGPVPTVQYTPEEQQTWRTVWEHLEPLHHRYACGEYLDAARMVRLDRKEVPQLEEVNGALRRATGFAMKPVAGLVGDRTFLGYLSRGTFLATQYMRHPSRPLYTPEPDVVHELVGHAASFCDERFARLNRSFGKAAERVDAETLSRVARLYWYTLEFGVCREKERSRRTERAPLVVRRAGRIRRARRPARVRSPGHRADALQSTGYQTALFVAPSFAEMADRACAWLDELPTAAAT